VEFRALPLDADEGIPQRVTVSVGGRTYDVSLHAQVTTRRDDPPEHIYDLAPAPAPGSAPGFLVLRIDRRGPDGPQTLLLRKLVVDPTLVHEAHELAVVLREARIARGNLNGRGQLGSRVVIGVAERWV
jgi:hypothetical protein